MRVIFLDVDGVLNCEATFMAKRNQHHVLDDELIARCNELVAATGAKIVLSSTWRLLPETREVLTSSTLDVSALIGATPMIRKVTGQQRGDEIAAWLAEHPEVERYVILDDDSDMLDEQKPWFVQTHHKTGLTAECAERAKRLLLDAREKGSV